MLITKRWPDYCVIWFVVLLIFTNAGKAAAQPGAAMDTVTFANGDRLSGKFVNATSDSVTFDASVTKIVTLQWVDIRELDLTADTSVAAKNDSGAKPVTARVIRVEGQSLVLNPETATAKTVPIGELTYAGAPVAAASAPLWGGQISSDNSILIATQHQYQLGGTLNLGHTTASQEAFSHQADEIHLEATFGESQKPKASPVITRLYEASYQHDIYVTDAKKNADGGAKYGGPRVFVLTDLYDNLSLGMKLEQAYGGGVAWDTEQGRQRFGAGADIRYIGEDLYLGAKHLDLAASAISENYSIRFPLATKKLIIISERGSVIPAFNDFHALQARGIAEVTVPLTKNLSIGPSLTDDYLQNAPPTSKQNYLSIRLSLSYLIGAPAAP